MSNKPVQRNYEQGEKERTDTTTNKYNVLIYMKNEQSDLIM